MTTVDACICTFRRKSVVDTLESLMAIDVPTGTEFAVLVIDNDTRPSAQDAVLAFARQSRWPVRYIHCPARNISIARNGALGGSDARFVAFIDDDEIASRGWLCGLLRVQSQTAADVVLGPVDARYGDDVPAWMQQARVHATRPVWVGGQIRTGYTGNVLIDLTSAAVQGLRFDPALGRSGGEDTAFFSAIHRAGGRIAYAADAAVEETVPATRARLGWLMQRKFRMGQTHAQVVVAQPGKRRWTGIPVAAAKLAFCAVATVLSLPHRRSRNLWALRGCLHAGVVAGLAGRDALQSYGYAEPIAGGPTD